VYKEYIKSKTKESLMTKQEQIQDLLNFLSENGVNISGDRLNRSEDEYLKLLNKLVRELVA
jgi:hypothetical protein